MSLYKHERFLKEDIEKIHLYIERGYQDRIKQDCAFPVKEVKFRPSDINLKKFEYRELDFAFVFYDILMLIEVKDNLFWDLDDLPPSIYLMQQNELKKLEEKVKLLELQIIKTQLSQENIIYNSIRANLVTQDHLATKDRTDYLNLVQELFNIQDQKKGVVGEH